jgi:hypothetical protein
MDVPSIGIEYAAAVSFEPGCEPACNGNERVGQGNGSATARPAEVIEPPRNVRQARTKPIAVAPVSPRKMRAG